jgi:DNA helicase IV
VLGDLAQTTTAWLRDDWSELTAHLTGAPTDVRTLSIGYRVPAEVLELAARQLELADPGLVAPRSIRRGAGAPAIVAAETEAFLLEAVQQRASEALEAGRSTAILVADGAYDTWAQALQSFSVGDGKDADFSRPLTLLPQSAAKGLEFDSVILVEPAAIADEVLQPSRSLYVAMTRCTQSLTILHGRPLPDGLSPTKPVAVPAGDQRGSDRDPEVIEKRSPVALSLHDMIDDLSAADLQLVHQLVSRLVTDREGVDES